jgi:hypothetical protein
MAIFVVPEDAHRHTTVLCVICLQKVPLTEVTAGSLYADGHQAFACTIHLHDRTRWITEWAIFDARQDQQKEIAALAEEIQ